MIKIPHQPNPLFGLITNGVGTSEKSGIFSIEVKYPYNSGTETLWDAKKRLVAILLSANDRWSLVL